MVSSLWWQSYKAFLVDQNGFILTSTVSNGLHHLGEGNDPLEVETLKALQERRSGTVLGPGHPPEEVSGFCRLEEVPWSLVIFAPGRKILAPVITFRNYYLAVGGVFVILLSLLIRWVAGTTAIAIRDGSAADILGTADDLIPLGRKIRGQYDLLEHASTSSLPAVWIFRASGFYEPRRFISTSRAEQHLFIPLAATQEDLVRRFGSTDRTN